MVAGDRDREQSERRRPDYGSNGDGRWSSSLLFLLFFESNWVRYIMVRRSERKTDIDCPCQSEMWTGRDRSAQSLEQQSSSSSSNGEQRESGGQSLGEEVGLTQSGVSGDAVHTRTNKRKISLATWIEHIKSKKQDTVNLR